MTHDEIAILTDGAGAATAYSTKPLDGPLSALRVVPGTLAATADLTITDAVSGVPILTVTNLTAATDYYPRAAAVNPGNSAIANSFAAIPVTGAVKVVVTQGGAGATATVHVWIE